MPSLTPGSTSDPADGEPRVLPADRQLGDGVDAGLAAPGTGCARACRRRAAAPGRRARPSAAAAAPPCARPAAASPRCRPPSRGRPRPPGATRLLPADWNVDHRWVSQRAAPVAGSSRRTASMPHAYVATTRSDPACAVATTQPGTSLRDSTAPSAGSMRSRPDAPTSSPGRRRPGRPGRCAVRGRAPARPRTRAAASSGRHSTRLRDRLGVERHRPPLAPGDDVQPDDPAPGRRPACVTATTTSPASTGATEPSTAADQRTRGADPSGRTAPANGAAPSTASRSWPLTQRGAPTDDGQRRTASAHDGGDSRTGGATGGPGAEPGHTRHAAAAGPTGRGRRPPRRPRRARPAASPAAGRRGHGDQP